MAQDHLIEWLGIVLLFVFGITMRVHGHFIYHNKHGYKLVEREQIKMSNARKQVEKLFKDK